MSVSIPQLPVSPSSRYIRPTPSFEDVFGVAPDAIIEAMDAAGDDVPDQTPAIRLGIDSVGVWRPDVIVTIDDPFGSGAVVQAICQVFLGAKVPDTRRGLHMSRLGQLIADSVCAAHRSVASYAERLANGAAEVQYGVATVKVRARIPFIEEVRVDRRGRRKASLEHLDVMARHTCGDGAIMTDVGLRVSHLVACPCVQKTFAHARRIRGDATLDSTIDSTLVTHSQRCTTSVTVRGVRDLRSPAAMLARLDQVLFRTCNTLPRDAELFHVYRAHRSPQFIEDALRAAVTTIAQMWDSPREYRAVVGRSRSLESIHAHDLSARLVLRGGADR